MLIKFDIICWKSFLLGIQPTNLTVPSITFSQLGFLTASPQFSEVDTAHTIPGLVTFELFEQCVRAFVRSFVCLSVCPCVALSVVVSRRSSSHLSVCLSVCLSRCVSVSFLFRFSWFRTKQAVHERARCLSVCLSSERTNWVA